MCHHGNLPHPSQELKGKEEDNIYRGQNNYTKYIEGKETSQGSAASRCVWSGEEGRGYCLCYCTSKCKFT